MTQWRPLHAREDAEAEYDGPYPGVPSHMRSSLRVWVAGFLRSWDPMGGGPSYQTDLMRSIENALRLELNWLNVEEAYDDLQGLIETDPERYLADMAAMLWRAQLDRHGTDDDDVPFTVSQEEADAAVYLAIALVRLFSGGHVQRAD